MGIGITVTYFQTSWGLEVSIHLLLNIMGMGTNVHLFADIVGIQSLISSVDKCFGPKVFHSTIDEHGRK